MGASLAEAAEHGDALVVSGAIRSGSSPLSQGRARWTPLHRAVARGHRDVARTLIDSGANPNAQTETSGDTPLHLACTRGDAAITADLIRAGADPHLRNKSGWTALHAALFYKHEGVTRVLRRNGARDDLGDHRHSSAAELVAAQGGLKLNRSPGSATEAQAAAAPPSP
jgi:ankyrin repeat protein